MAQTVKHHYYMLHCFPIQICFEGCYILKQRFFLMHYQQCQSTDAQYLSAYSDKGFGWQITWIIQHWPHSLVCWLVAVLQTDHWTCLCREATRSPQRRQLTSSVVALGSEVLHAWTARHICNKYSTVSPLITSDEQRNHNVTWRWKLRCHRLPNFHLNGVITTTQVSQFSNSSADITANEGTEKKSNIFSLILML